MTCDSIMSSIGVYLCPGGELCFPGHSIAFLFSAAYGTAKKPFSSAKQIIFSHGDRSDSIFYIESGTVKGHSNIGQR